MKPVIGFIGLGIMGKPMVRNLLAAGYTVHTYSMLQEDVAAVSKDGALGEPDGLAVAKSADIIIIMVPNTPDVEAVIFGENGIINAMKPGKIIADMSTISATAVKEFAERVKATGARMIDAPVSGGETGAINGTLSIMVGGEEDVFNRCLPVFEVLGDRVTLVGGNGAGQAVKSCSQVLSAVTMAAIGEALVMGVKAGVAPEKIVEVLSAGYARCGCLEIRGQQILDRNFEPGFKSKLHYKDLGLAMELSRNVAAPMPLSSAVHEFYKSCMTKSLGEEDHSNVIKVFEEMGQVTIRRGHTA